MVVSTPWTFVIICWEDYLGIYTLNPTEQTEYLIDLRRSRLQSLLAAGVNQTEYSRLLNVSEGTISGDCQYLRQHAKDYVSQFDEHFAEE